MGKKYTVVFEPDEGDWWAISIPSVKGVRTQAKSLEQGRKRIREALSLAIGDEAAEAAELVDDVKLADPVAEILRDAIRLAAQSKSLEDQAKKRMVAAAKALTKAGLSRRDAGELMGVSFQRVQQILENKRVN